MHLESWNEYIISICGITQKTTFGIIHYYSTFPPHLIYALSHLCKCDFKQEGKQFAPFLKREIVKRKCSVVLVELLLGGDVLGSLHGAVGNTGDLALALVHQVVDLQRQ